MLSKKMYMETAERLIKAIGKCTCSFTTVRYVREKLENSGYRELKLSEMPDWKVNMSPPGICVTACSGN